MIDKTHKAPMVLIVVLSFQYFMPQGDASHFWGISRCPSNVHNVTQLRNSCKESRADNGHGAVSMRRLS